MDMGRSKPNLYELSMDTFHLDDSSYLFVVSIDRMFSYRLSSWSLISEFCQIAIACNSSFCAACLHPCAEWTPEIIPCSIRTQSPHDMGRSSRVPPPPHGPARNPAAHLNNDVPGIQPRHDSCFLCRLLPPAPPARPTPLPACTLSSPQAALSL